MCDTAENATRNGGCGAYIKRPGKPPFSVSAPGGILCSNFRAEVLALLNATETIISWEEKPKKAVFLTDSLSALQALMSGEPDTTQNELKENISTLAQTTCIIHQWIPAHTGVRGNEIADQLTKEGRERSNPHHICPTEKSKLLSAIKKKEKKKAIFHCKTGGYNPNQDAFHQLPRHQQTTIFRLRTGHCRLNSHLKRIGVKTSALCSCGEEDQTPEPYLQSCSLYHQSLEVCRGFVPDIQVCGTHGRDDLVNATITLDTEEEEWIFLTKVCDLPAKYCKKEKETDGTPFSFASA